MHAAAETLILPSQGDFSLLDLDADNLNTVEETKARIQEILHSSRDSGLLNTMVEYYLKTRSPACLQILSGIHEARAQALFEKMNECLKQAPSRLDTLSLLGHIVRRQPSWLYKIIKTSLFESLLKCMKGDEDVLVLTSGILTITTLLPLVPAYIGHCLQDLFEIFSRLSYFRVRHSGNAPEVHLLHLHVAVYMLFHRLYAMYPNNFLAYLRVTYCKPPKQKLFQKTIKPMLEHVKLHPCIITETVHTETEKHRWRQKEPHDIVIECMKLSLDPVDRMQEKGSLMSSWTFMHSHQELFSDKSISPMLTTSGDSQGPETSRLKERRMSDSATQTGKSLQSGDSGTESDSLPVIATDGIELNATPGWSPSDVCGLNTPPSSQMSPSTSYPDLVSSIRIQSHCSTPGIVDTPGQSPTTSLGDDVLGYSSSPSLTAGSRGKVVMSEGINGGKGNSVKGGKAWSQEGALTKSLISVLAGQSYDSAPAAIGEQQTSTPRDSSEYQEDQFDTALFERKNSSTSLSTNEVQGEVFKENLTSLSPEKIHRDDLIVSPKEEFRDCNGQKDCHPDGRKLETIGPLKDAISIDVMEDALTPVCGQSLEAETLSNTPVDKTNESPNACPCTEAQETDIYLSYPVPDVSLMNKEPNKPPVSKPDLNAHQEPTKLGEVDENETSLKWDECSSSVSKLHSLIQAGLQNHLPLQVCDLVAAFPYLLPLLRNDQEQTVNSSLADGDDLISSRIQQQMHDVTPVEILDDYLKTGKSVHYGELSRIPLVNEAGTVWTHFGGDPPVDEVEILRGQVKLLHNQLLFERHKCDLHAIRNRRLVGKTFKAVQYQEELQATKDQLRLQEDKMRELTDALKNREEANREFKGITSAWDHQQQLKLRDLLNENAHLKYTQKELLEKLEVQQKDFDTKQTEINQVKARIFTLEKELDQLRTCLTEKDRLSDQMGQLVKELLIMGELNQQQKETIKKLSLVEGQNPESTMQLHSCHRELGAAKQTVKRQKAELEALNAKLADIESVASSKDIEIRELKKFSELLKGTYNGKIESLEEKYNAQKKMTQALESYILHEQSLERKKEEEMEHSP